MKLSKTRPETGSELFCRYSSQAAAELLREDGVLAVISSGPDCMPGGDPRHYYCGLPALTEPPLHEVWSTAGPIHSGAESALQWSHSDELLFAGVWVEPTPAADQARAVHAAYARLLRLARDSGFPAIVRIWNYLSDINRGAGDGERYRQFCLGRQWAFDEHHYDPAAYPAACALGHDSERSLIYLLAGRTRPAHIENPRQESAYHYPRQYGPASPSFARATQADWLRGNQLFISGTASIIGHATYYPDELEGQLQITLENLDTLLAQCTDGERSGAVNLLKVYVRKPDDLPRIQQAFAAHFRDVPTLYLRADICRRELLVEVDGTGALTAVAAHRQPA